MLKIHYIFYYLALKKPTALLNCQSVSETDQAKVFFNIYEQLKKIGVKEKLSEMRKNAAYCTEMARKGKITYCKITFHIFKTKLVLFKASTWPPVVLSQYPDFTFYITEFLLM